MATDKPRAGYHTMQNVRYLAGQLIGGTLAQTGLVSRRVSDVRSTGDLTNIYFHQPSQTVFEGCIRWLQQHDFQFISTADLEQAIDNGNALPPLAVHVSFDDAWRSNLTEVLPIVQSLDIPITIFVPTEPIITGNFWWTRVEHFAGDQYRTVERLKRLPDDERRAYLDQLPSADELLRQTMTLDELRSIASLKNITIGSHTTTHPIITNCDDSALATELSQSKQTLEEWLDRPITSFAYPNGDFGDREIQAVQHAGYKCAFTTRQQHQSQLHYKPFELPRFALPNDTVASENIARMTGLWPKRPSFTKHANPT